MTIITFGQTAITPPSISQPTTGANKQNPNAFIKWGPVPGAFSYELQIDTTSSFDNPDIILTQYTGANASNLYFGNEQFCRVRAFGLNHSDSSAWSTVSNFFVIDTVTVLKPDSNSTNSYSRLYINWNLISGATEYEYQIDTSTNFNSSYLVEGDLANSSNHAFSTQLYFNTDYFFRMRAIDSRSISSWSKPIPFKTTNTVKLVSPIVNSKNTETEVLLKWKTNGAYFYKYQISTDTNFSAFIEYLVDSTYIVTSASDTSVQIYSDTLLFDTKYFWRAQALNQFDTSGWSLINSFTTFQLITPTEPTNNSTNTSCIPIYRWTGFNGVRNYIIEVDTSVSFSNPKRYTVPGYETRYRDSLHALIAFTNYHWRIKATNYNDTTLWCATQNFKTGPYTSISSFENNDVCEFYPNPAKNHFNLLIGTSNTSSCEINIIDVMGQLVKTDKFTLNYGKNNKMINVSNLADGIYFVKIKYNNESITKKLIINN